MINVSFYLNTQKTDKKENSPVYMLLTFNGQRIRKAVKGIKTTRSNWNEKKGRLRPLKEDEYKVNEALNGKLESIEEAVHKINKVSLKFDIPLSKEFILTRIDNPSVIELTSKSFFHIFDEYIQSIRSARAPRTITGIQTVINFLKEYQNFSKTTIEFGFIDIRFFESLRAYSYKEKEIANNYFLKIITVLKAFMNSTLDRGYHNNDQYKKFKVGEVEKEVIYLTINELNTLLEFQFESKRLSHVRDIYCFSCFTGLRFSDVIALNDSHINENHISKSIQKTGETNNKIPLSRQAKAILNKYRDTIYSPLPKISHQKFNEYLKECYRYVYMPIYTHTCI